MNAEQHSMGGRNSGGSSGGYAGSDRTPLPQNRPPKAPKPPDRGGDALMMTRERARAQRTQAMRRGAGRAAPKAKPAQLRELWATL